MKAPNGYGGITKLSGRRRRPYVVRLTTGHNEKGYPIYKVLGYFRTRIEANMALSEYHRTPYNLDDINITTSELFEKAYCSIKNMSESAMKSYLYSFNKHIKPKIGGIPYKDIKLAAMQEICDSCEKPTAGRHIKGVFVLLDSFAMQNDIIVKSYSQFIKLETYVVRTIKKVFTYEEIAKLWENEKNGDITAKIILVYLYTGFRRNELEDMTKENISDGCFIGGSKTKAGKNRIVPIHSRIRHIIDEFLQDDSYLLPEQSKNFFYYTFPRYCEKVLGTRHVPHECRHTFITELNKRHADPICIDRIVGHSSGLVGHDVYTHKTIKELADCIELVKYE